ncbi:MAG: CRISPR-associated helicase Cas3' [Thermomicrobiales bacterium]|nr:CRISPR-associated helicase Cas3' [Thermomicrobiales bacterium]
MAELASQYAGAFGAGGLGRIAGLLHDLGKASPDFQDYLKRSNAEPKKRFQSVDHKGAGAVASAKLFQPLSMLIQGHHGGLPDAGDWKSWMAERSVSPYRELVEAANLHADRHALPRPVLDDTDLLVIQKLGTTPVDFEMFLRMLFSALVDADHTDTERYRNPRDAAHRRTPPELVQFDEMLTANQAEKSGLSDSPVNLIRHEVYLSALAAAELPPGLFKLTVPTGGGKTRSSLAFALRHAVRHELRRVIVVSPYLTITDQTADEYRSILGDGVVLEHHGDAARHDDSEGASTPEAEWRRVSSQNWDASIVVTTAVQFFESLFSNRTTRCRKLHRIVKSVVIIDEPQTLPTQLLESMADGIRQLVTLYGTTVLLCSATQPALDELSKRTGLPAAHEIAPEPSRLFRDLERVTFDWPDSEQTSSWDEIAENLRKEHQVLCIVNSRPNALSLLEALNDAENLHLSTLLCPAHRRDVLQVIHRRINAGLPCRVVSTQVVEAGVDLDFPSVYRAIGPLDRIVQAAGRCNREGKLHRGAVTVFEPVEGSLPTGAYKTATEQTKIELARGSVDPHDPATFERYFRSVYNKVSLDQKAIQDARAALEFETVNDKFRMIPDDSVSVIVRYQGLRPDELNEEPDVDHAAIRESLVTQLKKSIRYGSGHLPRDVVRRLQPYMVSMRRGFVERRGSADSGLVHLGGDIWEWEGGYHPILGIGRMDAAAWDAADLVIS